MAIHGTLLGFGDYFSVDAVGDDVGAASTLRSAAPQPRKPVAGPQLKPRGATGAKAGKYFRSYPKPQRTQAMLQQGKVLSKAKAILLKGAKSIGRAQVALAKKPGRLASPAAGAQASTKIAQAKAAQQRAVAVHASPAATAAQKSAALKQASLAKGAARRAIVGAVTAAVKAGKPVPKSAAQILTPKAKAAIAKYNKTAAASKKAGQVLAKQTLKTRDTVKALAKRAVAQKKTSKLIRTPLKKRAGIKIGALLGCDDILGESTRAAFDEFYSMVGASPDPANPGFLDDGTLDPAFGWETEGAPVDAGMPMDTGFSESDYGLLMDEPVDSGVELPPPPPMDVFIADMNAVGGIAYDGSKGMPNGFVGSYGLFTRATEEDAPGVKVSGSDSGRNSYGYVWGSFDQDNVPNGIPWGGRLTENQWNKIYGRYVRAMPGSFNEVVPDTEAFASAKALAPNGVPYGPLVGNPGMPDFKSMRVDAAGNLFWLPQEAPDWLTFPLKQAAAVTAKAAAEAEAEARKQEQLAHEKEMRDAQAEKDRQDAALALSEAAAASEARIAQQAEVTAQAQQETAAQQALVEQQRMETTQAQQYGEQEQQAGEFILEQARQAAAVEQALMQQAMALEQAQAQRQEEFFKQNPELEVALQAQAAGLLEDVEPTEEQASEEQTPEDAMYEASAVPLPPDDEGGEEQYEEQPSEDTEGFFDGSFSEG